MRILWCVVALIVVLVLASMCVFSVDRSEFVYVTRLGRHVVTYDGAKPEEAGLHLRLPWPIQSVQRLDRRLQLFDLDPTEQITADAEGQIDRRLTIEAFVCWQI